MTVTNKEIDFMRQTIDSLKAKRDELAAEVDELKQEQQNMKTDDLESAVKRHQELFALIAGRESVIRKLDADLAELAAALEAEVKVERKRQFSELRRQIDAKFEDLSLQMMEIYDQVLADDFEAQIAKCINLSGRPYVSTMIRNEQELIKSAAFNVISERYDLRTNGWVRKGGRGRL